MKRLITTLIASSFIAILYVLLKPVDDQRTQTVQIESVVTKINKGRMGDYIIELEDKTGMFFISKANIKDVSLDSLVNKLSGQRVSISFIKPNILSRFGRMINKKQVTKLTVGCQTVFSTI